MKIGLFPDVGASWFLSRLPGEVGLYLGLTGRSINGRDAKFLGLATHIVKSSDVRALEEALLSGRGKDHVMRCCSRAEEVRQRSGDFAAPLFRENLMGLSCATMTGACQRSDVTCLATWTTLVVLAASQGSATAVQVAGTLPPLEEINEVFEGDSVGRMIDRLHAKADSCDWAAEALDMILAASPLAVYVTLR